MNFSRSDDGVDLLDLAIISILYDVFKSCFFSDSIKYDETSLFKTPNELTLQVEKRLECKRTHQQLHDVHIRTKYWHITSTQAG